MKSSKDRTSTLLHGENTMSAILLAIDQGTTGTTAAFFDYDSLQLLANAKVEFPQIFPKPGWVEHDAEDIWRSALQAIRLATLQLETIHSGRKVDQVKAIGITNQRETVVPWHRVSGECAHNALVWQDRRTAPFCDELKANTTLRKKILETTGLVCDPYFSGTKMLWLLQNSDKAKSWAKTGDLVLGTIDSWILYKLTGGKTIATDHTNASRTMLYNLHTGDYDEELLGIFGVKRPLLPEIRPSIGSYGVTKGVAGLPDGIPITGILGDQQSALMGQNCLNEGEAKITYGTGAFLLMNTGNKPMISDVGLLATVACSTAQGRTFAVEGAAFIAGAAVQFLRDNFNWVKTAAESLELASSATRDPNVIFIPALAGLGAPYWNPNAKGALLGLTRGTKKAQIVRAVLESIAIQNVQILRLMETVAKLKLRKVGVDGGASKNDLLMQFQADVLRIDLHRPENIETTAKGAVRAARMGLGGELAQRVGAEPVISFVPHMEQNEATAVVSSWVRAVEMIDKFYSSMM
jgi:glycerol kinase